jgi:FlaA1/EpsC-like NDP-sugar epimerase
MRIKTFTLASIAFAAALLVGVALLFTNSESHHPYVVFEAPENLKITFLHTSRKNAAECESATANVVNLIQTGCRACRLATQQCLRTLTPDQARLLSDQPLPIPSIGLPDGIVTYAAPNDAYALAACKESEQQSVRFSGDLVCQPPGKPRPGQAAASPAVFSVRIVSQVALIAFALSALTGYAYFLLGGGIAPIVARLLKWPRRQKQALILVVDVLSIESALWLAFALRMDTIYVPEGDALWLFFIAPLLALPVFVGFGLYRSVIRYLGMRAYTSMAKAVAVYAAFLALAVYVFAVADVPRSIVAIHGIIAFILIGATRALARNWLHLSQATLENGPARKSVVVYGAGSAGIQLATALSHSKELRPIAFLDDDVRLHGSRLGELEVFSPLHLQTLIDRFQAKEVLLAVPSTSRSRRKEIIAMLESLPVEVRTLPGLSDLAKGKVKMEDLRKIDIEDLLGRDPVAPDPRLLKANIAGKSVMITGAGGSIGSDLCRQILALQPSHLILYEQSEFALYEIEKELINQASQSENSLPPDRIFALLGSVTDQVRLERVIETMRVETIFHAAAYKHVPMVERNPCEGVLNNIIGTYRTAQAALNKGVESFVLISTDKAVRPTNTMGTSKRFSEMILQALAETVKSRKHGTRFTIVRFGNVLGSSGSVVPLFREQIARGGPVTVTDPRIERYFMTIPEATQLVIQAGAMGAGGEVFVLDMGEPVKIIDLAQRMIRLSGLQIRTPEEPSGDIEIVYSGLRPGEKLYEELLIGNNASTTEHPRIMRANEKKLPIGEIRTYLARLEAMLGEGDSNGVRSLLLEVVEEFNPQCGNEDLLQLQRHEFSSSNH